MTVRTPRPPRALLGVRALLPLSLLSLIAVPAAFIPAAHAQTQLWITQFGTSNQDSLTAVESDAAGGVMVAGWTIGSLGRPNPGCRPEGCSSDAILARYDGAGTQLWMRQFGTGTWEQALALASDGAGGVMVTGWTDGSLGGPNAGCIPGHYCSSDVFLARYDADGNQIWIRQFGSSEFDMGFALSPDGVGGVMVAGQIDATFLAADVFVARYDSVGNQLWIRQFGTSSKDGATALAPDGVGGAMVAGTTEGDLGGPNAGSEDAFLARYDGAGNRIWIRQFGTNSNDGAAALASDGAGGVIVAGATEGDLGGPNAGLVDAFLARYDSTGDRLWIRQFGTSSDDFASAVAPDGAGGVLVTGWTEGNLGGPNAGGSDAFLARYDSAGNRLWLRQFGSTNYDDAVALSADGAGDVMVAGRTWGSMGGLNVGLSDAYLASYAICYADCDKSGALDIFDFLCFQSSFLAGEFYACNCDTTTGAGVCDIFDFLCFQNAFVGGCS